MSVEKRQLHGDVLDKIVIAYEQHDDVIFDALTDYYDRLGRVARRFTSTGMPLDHYIYGSEAAAPAFYLEGGSEIGYHMHLYRTIKRRDTGLLVTAMGDAVLDVFAEPHRKGKNIRPVKPENIGRGEKVDIVEQAAAYIGRFPEEARRKPSKKAVLLGTHAVAFSR